MDHYNINNSYSLLHIQYLYPIFPSTTAAPKPSLIQFYFDDVRETELSAAASRRRLQSAVGGLPAGGDRVLLILVLPHSLVL